MILLLAQAASAACPMPSNPQEVVGTVVRGEIAFQNGDPTGLADAATTTRSQIPCLSGVLGITEAAGVYRLWGYAAFVARDKPAATGFFAVARGLDPDYELPPVVVPEHHPMRALYDEADPRPGPTKLVELPEGHTARVDGIETVVYPTNRESIFQQVDGSGRVVGSALVGPGQVPPVMLPTREPYEWSLSVLGGARVWLRERSTFAIGPSLRGDFPIAGALGVDVVLTAHFSAVREGLVLVPDLRAGFRWQLDGDPEPRFGAALLFASHSYAAVAPGGAITFGFRTGRLDLDVLAGYAGGITAGFSVGARLR